MCLFILAAKFLVFGSASISEMLFVPCIGGASELLENSRFAFLSGVGFFITILSNSDCLKSCFEKKESFFESLCWLGSDFSFSALSLPDALKFMSKTSTSGFCSGVGCDF